MKTKRSSSALAVWEERRKENKTPQLSSQLPNVELLKEIFILRSTQRSVENTTKQTKFLASFKMKQALFEKSVAECLINNDQIYCFCLPFVE